MKMLMNFAQAIENPLAQIDMLIQHQFSANPRLERIRRDFVMMYGVGFIKMQFNRPRQHFRDHGHYILDAQFFLAGQNHVAVGEFRCEDLNAHARGVFDVNIFAHGFTAAFVGDGVMLDRFLQHAINAVARIGRPCLLAR